MPRVANRIEQSERISRAVWEVLAESGPQGLTLRAVAKKADCTTGLVLHRFPDKSSLLIHARELLHQRTAERTDRLETLGGEPIKVLRSVLMEAVSLTKEKQQEARVWLGYLAAALSNDELATRHVKANQVFFDRIQRLVTNVQPKWDVDMIFSTTTTLVALVEGLNALSTVDYELYSPETQARAVDRALGIFGLTK